MSCGELIIRVPSGKPLSTGTDIPDNCFIEIRLPPGISRDGLVKSQSCDGFQFRMNKSIQLEERLKAQSRIKITLVEYNRILSNNVLGSADVSLAPLLSGQPYERSEIQISDTSGKPKFGILLSCSWKNPPAGAIGGAGDASSSPTGASATSGALVGSPATAARPMVAGTLGGGQNRGSAAAASLPDCNGQSYGVRVKVHRLKNLQSTDAEKLYNAKVLIKAADRTFSTDCVKGDNDPTFDEEANFSFEKVDANFWTESLLITVLDHNTLLPDEQIGVLSFDFGSLYRSNSKHSFVKKWFIVVKAIGDGTVMGYAKLSIAIANLRTDPVIEFEDERGADDEADDDIVNNLIRIPGAVFESLFLHGFIVKANDLPKMDSGLGTCDGYCKIRFGTKSSSTDFIDSNYNPVWNTMVTVPMMLPNLTSFIRIELWDHDSTSPDDLIGTVLLDSREISKGRQNGLPSLYPRFVNFIGHPRACDATYNKYFKEQATGSKPGCDYRGRLLVGFLGSKSKNDIQKPKITETNVTVKISVEILQVSHIGDGGDVRFSVFCGKNRKKSARKYDPQKMSGEGSKTYSFYCGETIEIQATVPIILPPDDHNESAYFASDSSRQDRIKLLAWQQLPPVIVHLVSDSAFDRITDALSGSTDEEPIASLVIPAESFYQAAVSSLSQQQKQKQAAANALPGSNYNGIFMSASMSSMKDPGRASEGSVPADPLLQINAAMTVMSVQPEHPLKAIAGGEGSKFYSKREQRGATEKFFQALVYHAKNFPAGDDNGLSDPYVTVSWGSATAKTGYKSDTLNPTYNEALYMFPHLHDPAPDILVELFDYDMIGSDTFLGHTLIKVADLKHGELMWVTDFKDSTGKSIPDTSILMSFEFADATPQHKDSISKQQKIQMKHEPDGSSGRTYSAYPIPTRRQLPLVEHTLNLKIVALRQMRKFRLRKIDTAHVVFECLGHRISTSVADELGNLSEECNWTIKLPTHDTFSVLPDVSILVYDRRLGSDTLVATANLNLNDDWLDNKKKEDIANKQEEEFNKKMEAIKKIHMVAQNEVIAVHDSDRMDELFQDDSSVDLLQRTASAASGGSGDIARSIKLGATPANDGDNGGDEMNSSSPARNNSGNNNAQSELNQPLINGGDDDIVAHNATTSSSISRRGNTSNSGSELQTPPTMRNQVLDRAILDAFDALDAERQTKSVDETQSNVSSEQDELLYYDKFDPMSVCDDDGIDIPPYQRVARLGRLGRYKEGKQFFAGGRTTAEDVFGPFDDGNRKLQLQRGWGSDYVKAGWLVLDATLRRTSTSPSTSASAAASSSSPTTKKTNEFHKIPSRERKPFLCRIYIIQCRDLTAMDSSVLTGKSSDPYCILTLSSGSGNSSSKDVVINCKDAIRYQVTDPEFFIVRELSGELPLHSTLKVTVLDWDRFSIRDDVIGSTEIDLEERYFSRRGYRQPRPTPVLGVQPDQQNYSTYYGLNCYGSYTEKRLLRNESGMKAGTIEMLVDVFDFSSPIPRPIDIAPPPPIPLELRVTVWNVRDCELTEENFAGEAMSDIYVRCWLDGMDQHQQNTDVHYRSLDGSGSFNWRMIFRFVFDPRLKKIFPYVPDDEDTAPENEGEGGGKKKKKESGGASSTAAKKFFGIRKEAKKLRPRLKCQIWDNDLFPGSDDFIGETTLDLLGLIPAFQRREKVSLARGLTEDCRSCWLKMPCSSTSCCQCDFCQPQKDMTMMDLPERQKLAQKERDLEDAKRRDLVKKEVEMKMKQIQGKFSSQQLEKVKKRLEQKAYKASKINVFKDFLPQRLKKSQREAEDKKHNQEMLMRKAKHGIEDASAIAGRPQSSDKPPTVSEITRNFFITRTPNGGCRVGDVQMSFELVSTEALDQDEKLAAGKGRSEPQALPEPDRPDTSFFWLSSPWKSAVHIFWKNYKNYIITVVCIILGLLFLYLFLAQGIETKSTKFFA